MKLEKIKKESFTVVGKEGSTLDGDAFILQLWNDFSDHFEEVRHLAKRDDEGKVLGYWGLMNDFLIVSNLGKRILLVAVI